MDENMKSFIDHCHFAQESFEDCRRLAEAQGDQKSEYLAKGLYNLAAALRHVMIGTGSK